MDRYRYETNVGINIFKSQAPTTGILNTRYPQLANKYLKVLEEQMKIHIKMERIIKLGGEGGTKSPNKIERNCKIYIRY